MTQKDWQNFFSFALGCDSPFRTGREFGRRYTAAAAGADPELASAAACPEGQLSREAVAGAAEAEGLRVFHVPPERAADAAVTAIVAEISRAAGPPWAVDQRHAAAAAWLALN